MMRNEHNVSPDSRECGGGGGGRAIPGAPPKKKKKKKKAERSIFLTLKFENIAYFDSIR